MGEPKIDAAVRRLREINPDVDLVSHPGRLSADNAESLIVGYDVVVDGSDTFSTRYAVNDASVATGVSVVYASVNQFSGQASVLGAENGPCYRCLFPEPPPPGLIPNCEDGGVLGVVPSVLGSIQATEALKLILGIGRPLVGRLLLFDALAMETREIAFSKDPDCPACGSNRQPVAIDDVAEVTTADLRARPEGTYTLLDVRDDSERAADHMGGQWIPLGVLEGRLDEVEGDRPVVVYCASGVRSARAAGLLRARGHDASSLRGGLAAWRASEAAS